MTAIVISAATIAADLRAADHAAVAGTHAGWLWHRREATRSTACPDCAAYWAANRRAHHTNTSGRARHPEFVRLVAAGVNRDTAAYLTRVIGIRRRHGLATNPPMV